MGDTWLLWYHLFVGKQHAPDSNFSRRRTYMLGTQSEMISLPWFAIPKVNRSRPRAVGGTHAWILADIDPASWY